MNIGMVKPGCVITFTYRLCSSLRSSSRGPVEPRPATGSARSARVTGAPSSSRIGDSMEITMCCTMCTLNMTMP